MHHTLVVLVEDKPGVLARVASQFRRRMFNIESMSASVTAPGITSITFAVDSDQTSVDRLVGSLSKLVNVLQVEDLADRGVARGLALVKVARANGNPAALQRIVDDGRGRIVATGDRTITVEITGDSEQIDAVVLQLEEFGIVDMARTGLVVLAGGDDKISKQ